MVFRCFCTSALVLTIACSGDTSDIGKIETVVVAAFPVVAPAGGWGPDQVQPAADYADYTHQYFCEAELVVRTEHNPACEDGVQDCGTTSQRVVEVKRTTCAEPGTPFTMRRVSMLGAGVIGGTNKYREDPLSGSCAAGFQLGRQTEHPFEVRFADVATCDHFVAAIQEPVKLAVDFVTVGESTVQFVGFTHDDP